MVKKIVFAVLLFLIVFVCIEKSDYIQKRDNYNQCLPPSFNVDASISFLKDRILESGEFYSQMCYKNDCKEDNNYFVTISVMLLLLDLETELFDYSSSIEFVKNGMFENGLWRFWVERGRAWDIDDTSLASYLISKKGLSLVENEKLILSNLNAKGLLKTWIPISDGDKFDTDEIDVCLVANANAFLYIKSEPERSVFCKVVDEMIENRSYENMILYYPDPLDFYFAISKTHKSKECLSQKSVEYILKRTLEISKKYSSSIETNAGIWSKTVLTMLNLGFKNKDILCSLIDQAFSFQTQEGGFVSGVHFKGAVISNTEDYTWKSDALTTAYVMAAFFELKKFIKSSENTLTGCVCDNY